VASMDYLLFFIYLTFFAWLVTRTSFFLSTGLTRPQLVIIFLLKVIAGIFYGWMGSYYGGLAQMADTWGFHYNAKIEYQLLGTNPAEYFTNIFNDPYPGGAGSFFASSNSYWNDLKGNVFIKLLSIFDVFSFGSYYVNVIFYAFITLFGPMALYKVMNDVFPGRRTILLFAVFFIPSFYYWASGIHKEGLIFAGIAMIIYHIYFAAKEKEILREEDHLPAAVVFIVTGSQEFSGSNSSSGYTGLVTRHPLAQIWSRMFYGCLPAGRHFIFFLAIC
jgi:hypothetical protein